MKTLSFVSVPVIFFFFSLFLFNQPQNNSTSDKVNSVIGDISFISRFGYEPTSNSNESLRIQTHLEYVENLLRNKYVSALSFEVQQKRNHLLNLLHEYYLAGKFPANFDHNDRRPCFIDKNGNICAVGYLIERTAGRHVAEYINEKFKYDLITDMNDEIVNDWITVSGFTVNECAMIQPSYRYINDGKREISNENAILSATLSAANLSLNVINGIEISNKTGGSLAPYIGMVTGVTQIVLGIANLPGEKNDYNEYRNSGGAKVLSLVNIGVGASTFVLSLWNAIDKRKESVKDKKTSWNIYSHPEKEKKFNIGFSLKHTF